MGDRLRSLTPLVLLALCGLVWLEPILPGASAIRENLGETAVLRFVVGLLALFVLILMVERQHLQAVFEQILGKLQALQGGLKSPAEGADLPSDASLKRDAVGILAAALRSDDASVRKNAAENLQRLTGQKFGEDADRWAAYAKDLSDQE